MRLYSGSSKQFVEDTVRNQIMDKLSDAFFDYFRYRPPHAEFMSWRNSLRAMAQVVKFTRLDDHGILLKYQLPQSSRRLDCMICGYDRGKRPRAVIVELKQWETCEASDGDNEVVSWVGGGKRDVLHPSVQVDRYHSYLEDTHTSFYDADGGVRLDACAYLHNYSFVPEDTLLSEKFAGTRERSPVFSADDVAEFSTFLKDRLAGGNGLDVLTQVEESRFRPSKKLMDHVGTTIRGHSGYVLLDEQPIAYGRIFAAAKAGFHDKRKSTLIVRGGPGTGKSVHLLVLYTLFYSWCCRSK